MTNPVVVTDLTKVPEEVAVALLMEAQNVSEADAEFQLALMKGEIDGDIERIDRSETATKPALPARVRLSALRKKRGK